MFQVQCCIQQFLGGAGFSMSLARRKTAVQPGRSGGEGGGGGSGVIPPQCGPRVKLWKILAILHSE